MSTSPARLRLACLAELAELRRCGTALKLDATERDEVDGEAAELLFKPLLAAEAAANADVGLDGEGSPAAIELRLAAGLRAGDNKELR